MNKLYAVIGSAALLGFAAYMLVQYGRLLESNENLETIAALQNSQRALGLVIQEREGKVAESARKAVDAERGRINAITTTDHQSEKIKQLQQQLDGILHRQRNQAIPDKPTNRDTGNYRIMLVDSFSRVYEEARNCGLPDSDHPGILQKRLPEVSADDINGIIKYAVGEYCGCGIQYNQLWRAFARVVNDCNNVDG